MAIFIHRHLPKSYTDLAAFLFLLSSVHAILLFELFVVLPSISQPHGQTTASTIGYWFHVVVGFYTYFNVLICLYKVIMTDTSVKGRILPSTLQQGWRFCILCECNAPPRSFHCHTCNTCILKRDHHCTFTGYCVGHANQRYYISLILYCAMAAVYSCFLNADYLYHLFGEVSLKTLLTISFPMISWFFIGNEKVTGLQTFMTSLCLIGLFMSCGLLVYHVVNIWHGQTVYEKTFNIKSYNLGWRENLRQVFGSHWKIAWISPLIVSPLPGDGIQFLTNDQYETPKAI